jgi:hypothetical protein
MTKLRATVIVEYDPQQVHYEAARPSYEMAALDQDAWQQNPQALFTSFPPDQFRVRVEVIDPD